MIAYPDTSFLCAIYREQIHSPLADAYKAAMTEPLHFTRLLEFEFIQAIRLQVWLHAMDRKKGYAESEADQMIADWEADVASGVNVLLPCDEDAVLRLARTYSLQRTALHGHRTLDILHVATAVHLGAKVFLTFDARQRALARYAGLRVPLKDV
jgi:predicted nucleic acid-binding protein